MSFYFEKNYQNSIKMPKSNWFRFYEFAYLVQKDTFYAKIIVFLNICMSKNLI